ncbi:MAG: hypothetical protein WD877_00015 [Candidatus Saccharimonadales bacterium]
MPQLIVRRDLSTPKSGTPLDSFKLFYEEISSGKPVQTRIRKVRQTALNS